MRIALIGLGHVAQFQVQACSALDSVMLTDACDVDPGKAAVLPLGVRFHADVASLLKNSRADVFLVATPVQTHFPIVLSLLEAGKSVIVEKPACLRADELHRLAELAEKRSLFLHVALHASFAEEVRWWADNQTAFHDLGCLVGFDAGFFDPYVQNGTLSNAALSLGGSWIDSGINALSVIASFIDPTLLMLQRARMTRIPQIPCSQIQGSATFSFPAPRRVGRGIIDTNWTLGLNQKITSLFYEEADVVLHHSKESITIIRNGKVDSHRAFGIGLPRLVHHYIGVLRELSASLHAGQSNIRRVIPMHELLFRANDGQTEDLGSA